MSEKRNETPVFPRKNSGKLRPDYKPRDIEYSKENETPSNGEK